MKQRVAVTLATVWLASIVGASVPSGETTAFPILRPPGPSPDQYTPLLQKPRYYSQDDYGQNRMNDEPSGIKVANRQENADRKQKAITDSDRLPLPFQSAPNEFFDEKIFEIGEDSATPHRFQSNDMKTRSELDREAMRLSSIKVAFDEPINSELTDNTSQEDWMNAKFEDEDVMQQDEFVSDGTFEDEGPGSVEVYKLDLYKDRSILSPRPLKKNYLRNKSKIPKKVEAADQVSWKTKDLDEAGPRIPNTVSTFDQHTDELSPLRSFKDRTFGVGGVPELQVGCEGVEGSQRQKRSDSEKPAGISPKQSGDNYDSPSAHTSSLYIDIDDDSEEELDVIGGTDELFKLLSKATTTTGSPLSNGNRGDMDPRVKTPADLNRPRKKDKLPTRGDLGPSSEPNSTETIQAQVRSSDENPSQVNPRREQMSVEKELVENVRNKRSSDWGYPESDGVTNERRRRGHRGTRRHRDGKRRRRHGGERERERKENEIRKKIEAIDTSGKDYLRNPETHIRGNRDATVKRSQPSNLLRQPPTREDGRIQQIRAERLSEKGTRNRDENERKIEEYIRRNTPLQRRQSSGEQPSNLLRQPPTREDGRNQQMRAERLSEEGNRNRDENERKIEEYMRRNTPLQRRQSSGEQPSNLLRQPPMREDGRNQQMRAERLSEKGNRNRDENQRKLEEYMRRNTPLQRRQSSGDNQRPGQRQHEARTPNSNDRQPQNVRLPVDPVPNNQRIDVYAENRSRILEQKQRQVEQTSRVAYERGNQREQQRQPIERPQEQRQGKGVYHPRSQQEIERLNSLPVSAFIVINQEKPETDIPKVESRFGAENEIGFLGLNPSTDGRKVPGFPSPDTTKRLVPGPSLCVWAIVNCCQNEKRIAACFEASGCPHGHWDQPCTQQNRFAAGKLIDKLYGG